MADFTIPFEHRQSAHCETGVTSNLLKFHNLSISEPMAFGIGGGLFFGHFPFVKLNHLPLTSFRHAPGKIFNSVAKRLGLKINVRRFRNPGEAMDVLDTMLEAGIPTALQTGAFWLPYFPSAYRFHFNAHNIVVYGRKNGSYLVSDPNIEHVVTIAYNNLKRARFAKGTLAPKGKLYYPVEVPTDISFKKPIQQGIKEICFNMLHIPLPFLGIKGIRRVSRYVRCLPEKFGAEKAALHLGHLIRMQEEIGTGGAGFRFIFASFLEEAAGLLHCPQLAEISGQVTAVGDKWRLFATLSARNCKGRATAEESYDRLADLLLECADDEERIYRTLQKVRF